MARRACALARRRVVRRGGGVRRGRHRVLSSPPPRSVCVLSAPAAMSGAREKKRAKKMRNQPVSVTMPAEPGPVPAGGPRPCPPSGTAPSGSPQDPHSVPSVSPQGDTCPLPPGLRVSPHSLDHVPQSCLIFFFYFNLCYFGEKKTKSAAFGG